MGNFRGLKNVKSDDLKPVIFFSSITVSLMTIDHVI